MNILSVPCAPCMLHALVHAMHHVYYTCVLADPLHGAAQDITKSKKQKIVVVVVKIKKAKQCKTNATTLSHTIVAHLPLIDPTP